MVPNFAQQWLTLLCDTVAEAHSAIFLIPDAEMQAILPLAKWPENLNHFADFAPIVKYARKKNGQVCIPNVLESGQDSFDFFALPVYVQNVLLGIIVLKANHLPAEQHDKVFKTLQQGAQWLGLAYIRKDQNDEFYASVVNLLTGCFEQTNYSQALIRLTTELMHFLKCEGVAIGEYLGLHSQVVALSNSTQFDNRAGIMKKVADAMDEAIEQDCLIVFPNSTSTAVYRAHQEVARQFGSGSLLTIPMLDGDKIFGAITLLRNEEKPFNADDILFCEQSVALIGPFLALLKKEQKPIYKKIADSVKTGMVDLFGFKKLKLKLALLSSGVLLISTSLIQSDYHLTANAVLEGKMQRVIAAPIAGFLNSSLVQAGDTVHQGELLATLDDAELILELNKLTGQLQKFRREYREALSSGDLVKVRVVSAQIDQAAAEMELTEHQLQKIAMKAPFDGVVIEGDLSQKLGTPVELGDALFKLAPLHGYRVILKVPERLISHVKPGQVGKLALASLPNESFKLNINKITAVAKAENGENIFRVESGLENAPDILRPGMEGIAKINAGHQPLLWIWTHDIFDRLRLWLWSWLI